MTPARPRTGAAPAAAKQAAKKAAKKSATKQPAKTAKKAPVARTAAARKSAAADSPRATAGSPRSGAKPALSAADVAARIERRIAGLGDWRGERLAQIRRWIHEADPEVSEDWKWMGTPVWSHAGMLVLANPHKDKVKITFFHGAQLRDPQGLFNAGLGGGRWRAIDLREGDRLDEAAFKALLRAALDYNLAHAVPRSRGSRR